MQQFGVLNKGSTIGVCAPSAGCGNEGRRKMRAENAVKIFEKLGQKVFFTENCWNNTKHRSCAARERAKEFEQLFFDKNIDAIIAMAGGEFELEILPYLNFAKLKKAPNKIFQGFSDNTCIGFLLTTICDKQSIYGQNFTAFGTNKWHKSLKDNYNFLCGKKVKQISFRKYVSMYLDDIPGKELLPFKPNKSTHPKILSEHRDINLVGRLIGGCLDLLVNICGTKFDNVKNFCKKYEADGLIWFFESCDLTIASQIRAIWQLKNAGWFDNAKAILIGRPLNHETQFDTDYKEANYLHLQDLNIPVIIDLDIGHTDPTWFMLNGGLAHFECDSKCAKIEFLSEHTCNNPTKF